MLLGQRRGRAGLTVPRCSGVTGLEACQELGAWGAAGRESGLISEGDAPREGRSVC